MALCLPPTGSRCARAAPHLHLSSPSSPTATVTVTGGVLASSGFDPVDLFSIWLWRKPTPSPAPAHDARRLEEASPGSLVGTRCCGQVEPRPWSRSLSLPPLLRLVRGGGPEPAGRRRCAPTGPAAAVNPWVERLPRAPRFMPAPHALAPAPVPGLDAACATSGGWCARRVVSPCAPLLSSSFLLPAPPPSPSLPALCRHSHPLLAPR